MSDYISDEIEDLEERLEVYRRNVKRKPHLSVRIKSMENLLNAFYKARAFDEVLKTFDNSLSEGHMADDVCNIVNKYRGESIESD